MSVKHQCPICDATFSSPGTVDEEPTLRDALAMSALAANDWSRADAGMFSNPCVPAAFANFAYQMADAMLEARKKR